MVLGTAEEAADRALQHDDPRAILVGEKAACTTHEGKADKAAPLSPCEPGLLADLVALPAV